MQIELPMFNLQGCRRWGQGLSLPGAEARASPRSSLERIPRIAANPYPEGAAGKRSFADPRPTPRGRSMSLFARPAVAGIIVLMGLLGPSSSPAAGSTRPEADPDRRIALFPGPVETILQKSSIPVWDREEGVVIAGPSEAQLDGLRAQGVEPLWSIPDHGEAIHILSHDGYFTPPVLRGIPRFEINPRAMLYLLPAGLEMELPGLKMHALFHGVPRVALPPVRVHPAD